MKKNKKRKHNVPLSHSNLTDHETMRSHYDPNGSWTGTPEHKDYPSLTDSDLPVQDADDL